MARPNVLLICVDHWPGPLMGAAGHERILTPTLNQLAANGVIPEAAEAQHIPITACRDSRKQLFKLVFPSPP